MGEVEFRSYFGVKGQINKESLPYRLFEKAKIYGIWNPADIDFSQDREDWKTLTEDQRGEVTTLLSYFIGGEEAVTKDIIPMIMTCANKGWIEEEMYLTTFLFEEAKHVDLFRRVLENLDINQDLSHLVEKGHHMLFNATKVTMGRLMHDQSPEAIVDACVAYNMYAEGVSAESSYWYFEQALGSVNKMPGLLEGIKKLKQDESRHIAFGTFMLQRLINEDPRLLDRALEQLQSYEPITAIISAEFIKNISFGVTPQAVTEFAAKQLEARLSILRRAKDQTLDEILQTKESEIVI